MDEWRIVERAGRRDTLGEGAVWSARDGALYWVDILAPALNRFRPAAGAVERWPMPEPIGWVVERRDGGFIAGFGSGVAELDLDPLVIRSIADPEPDLPGNRMNDGKADAAGTIWFGTMDQDERAAAGALYRFGADRRIARMDGPYLVPNGPAFSPDGRWLYHNDTVGRVVYRFPRPTGTTLGAREVHIVFGEEEGHPDGMTVDRDGYLWIAHWGGSRVSRFAPDGRRDRTVALPARQVTNVAFGGAALDRLFVTSAATGLPTSPVDGALYEIDPGVAGIAAGVFPG